MLVDHLLPALMPLAARVRQDITWRKIGRQVRCERKTPLTKTTLKRHLRMVEQRGVCPIAEGQSTTRVALLDLDSHKGETSWEGMAFVCGKVCKHFEDLGFHPVAFRSTGGKGIHLYFIWDKAQDAYSLRMFFREEIGKLGFKDGTRGVSNQQIEIFPKQDSVPEGGAGNQFILPLSGESVPLEPLFGYEPVEREAALQFTWQINPDILIREHPTPPKPPAPETIDRLSPELRRMLAVIPNNENNYDLWILVGMALHNATEGSEEGLALWEDWSSKCSVYSGFEELRYKWNSFRNSKASTVTIGSLKKLATQHGWEEDYSNDFEEVVDEVNPETVVEVNGIKMSRFMPIRGDIFTGRKPPNWLIKGIIPEKSTGLTFGGSGDGKTFEVVDMVLAIAFGREWNDRITKRGHIVYICAEGSGAFNTRIMAYALRHNVKLKELGDFFKVIPAAPNFLKKDDVEEVAAQINTHCEKTDLIVVDTMAQTTTGGDENSAKDMGVALKYLEALRAKTNSATHLVHHSGKNEELGARGSSSIKATMDVQIQISRHGNRRLLWVDKMKDGIDKFGWYFDLHTIDINIDEDGEFVSSCCIEFDEYVTSREKANAKKEGKERDPVELLILTTWEELGGGTMAVNDVVEQVMRKMLRVEGTPDTRALKIKKALEKLKAEGEFATRDGQISDDLTLL